MTSSRADGVRRIPSFVTWFRRTTRNVVLVMATQRRSPWPDCALSPAARGGCWSSARYRPAIRVEKYQLLKTGVCELLQDARLVTHHHHEPLPTIEQVAGHSIDVFQLSRPQATRKLRQVIGRQLVFGDLCDHQRHAIGDFKRFRKFVQFGFLG